MITMSLAFNLHFPLHNSPAPEIFLTERIFSYGTENLYRIHGRRYTMTKTDFQAVSKRQR